MANYNPHLPLILGNEFVPIREENLVYTGVVNNVERGYSFRTTGTRTLSTGQFYLNEFPSGYTASNVYTINVYPKGREAWSGPVNSVIIPCNNGATSGDGASFFGAGSVAEAVRDPSSGDTVNIQFGTALGANVSFFFATNSYAQLLNGKRILGVNFLYAADLLDTGDLDDAQAQACALNLFVRQDSFIGSWEYPDMFGGVSIDDFRNQGNSFIPAAINRVQLGDTNMFFNTTGSGASVSSCMPWTYTDLRRFEASSPVPRLFMWTRTNGFFSNSAPRFGITYAALEVVYCEEQRIATGSALFTVEGQASTSIPYNYGTNVINMRNLDGTLNPVLASGTDYTVTLMRSNVGDQIITPGNGSGPPGAARVTTGPEASLNALREYYALPQLEPVQVNIPAPPSPDVDGQVFSKTSTAIIPQVTLNTSGGGLTEVQVYGRQAVAQVYGTVTAQQIIFDENINSSKVYPQVRYYARRFGDTTVPLSLDSTNFSPGTSPIVSITPAQFDALDELIDGWKEVTLTFPVSNQPSLGVGGDLTWRWSATGENIGNRWEVLGAIAEAISGTPNNFASRLAQAPNAYQLGPGSYGEPTKGTFISLAWVPGYAPYMSGAAFDQTSDATIIFSQDPPSISGFTVTGSTQAVSGIGLNCGLNPGFIPTAIAYNTITWNALSTGDIVTGFGYYELQRSDSITDWQTIMKSTTLTGSSFKDYEARIGMSSLYRIRVGNSLRFNGPWSATITGSSTSPGVSGTSLDSTSNVLVFTTNSHQNGSSNLAYALGWEGEVSENFNFPEAGGQTYQAMYNRDFVFAFRPLERGGTNFTRTLLVQAAAISPPTLEDFTSLRDMAWTDVPYICVRDQAGNRWFANVSVPSASVQRARRLYLAPVSVVQVTNTPTPVQP